MTVEDAEDVVEIMRNSMCDVFSDGTGGLAFDRYVHLRRLQKFILLVIDY